jgi:hypothetical protein
MAGFDIARKAKRDMKFVLEQACQTQFRPENIAFDGKTLA